MAPSSIGRYRILRELGRGATATVFLARDPGSGRQVALKLFSVAYTAAPDFAARFEQTVTALAGLDHPYLVLPLDHGQSDDQFYIVMRYLPGGTLADRMDGRPMLLAEVVPILQNLAEALDAAHAAHLLHGDLHPADVLFDLRERAFLTDLGLAQLIDPVPGPSPTGTAAYMSPEQIAGQPIDGRADVYALGILLFEMLTGRQPFSGATPPELLRQHLEQPVPQLSAAALAQLVLPLEFNLVIARALAKNRDYRYPTAGVLAEALRTMFLMPPAESALEPTPAPSARPRPPIPLPPAVPPPQAPPPPLVRPLPAQPAQADSPAAADSAAAQRAPAAASVPPPSPANIVPPPRAAAPPAPVQPADATTTLAAATNAFAPPQPTAPLPPEPLPVSAIDVPPAPAMQSPAPSRTSPAGAPPVSAPAPSEPSSLDISPASEATPIDEPASAAIASTLEPAPAVAPAPLPAAAPPNELPVTPVTAADSSPAPRDSGGGFILQPSSLPVRRGPSPGSLLLGLAGLGLVVIFLVLLRFPAARAILLAPTATPTATSTPLPSSTPSATPTVTPSITPSATASSTVTGTASPTASPSPTPTATLTALPTETATLTRTPRPTLPPFTATPPTTLVATPAPPGPTAVSTAGGPSPTVAPTQSHLGPPPTGGAP